MPKFPERLLGLTLTLFLALTFHSSRGEAAKPAAMPLPSSGRTADAALRSVLPSLRKDSKVAILLPKTMPRLARIHKVYATATIDDDGYIIVLSNRPSCDSSPCYLGSLVARREDKSFTGKIQLESGLPARFMPVSCNGSCSPPGISWQWHGVRYTIQSEIDNDQMEDALVIMKRLADEAIAAGPR